MLENYDMSDRIIGEILRNVIAVIEKLSKGAIAPLKKHSKKAIAET